MERLYLRQKKHGNNGKNINNHRSHCHSEEAMKSIVVHPGKKNIEAAIIPHPSSSDRTHPYPSPLYYHHTYPPTFSP
jgi:hypothetical protein